MVGKQLSIAADQWLHINASETVTTRNGVIERTPVKEQTAAVTGRTTPSRSFKNQSKRYGIIRFTSKEDGTIVVNWREFAPIPIPQGRLLKA